MDTPTSNAFDHIVYQCSFVGAIVLTVTAALITAPTRHIPVLCEVHKYARRLFYVAPVVLFLLFVQSRVW